jgi:hypothetical protein
MGNKKKSSFDNERKDKSDKKQSTSEQELADVPAGWKEPVFTKADNPHGRIDRVLAEQISCCH